MASLATFFCCVHLMLAVRHLIGWCKTCTPHHWSVQCVFLLHPSSTQCSFQFTSTKLCPSAMCPAQLLWLAVWKSGVEATKSRMGARERAQKVTLVSNEDLGLSLWGLYAQAQKMLHCHVLASLGWAYRRAQLDKWYGRVIPCYDMVDK